MAINTNLGVFKGDTPTFNLTIESGGAAVNITGYTFYFTVKELITDTDAKAKIAKKVSNTGSQTSGKVSIVLTSTDTNLTVSSSSQRYVYDIRMKDKNSKIQTLFKGTFEVQQPVLITPT